MRIAPSVFLLVLLSALPLDVAAQSAVKCGTPEVLPMKGRKVPLELPTTFRDSLRSPSGRFLIHYDATASNPDSITTAAYVQQAALLADSAYEFEIGTLGYPPPPYSAADHYDIYLTPKPYGAYGATVPFIGGALAQSASGLARSRTYVVVDNRFTDPIYATKGYDALRITIFHEFFHVIQFGNYGYSSANTYFQEMSSIWMEMESSPSIPDWLNPGPIGAGRYLATLDLQWDRSPTSGYGQGIFLKYLDTLYSAQIVRQLWQTLSDTTSHPLVALERVLANEGTDFCTTYRSFGAEVFQAGRRLQAHSVLPHAAEIPVDSIRYTIVEDQPASFESLPSSLNFFVRGWGADTCVAVLSHTPDQVVASGDLRMPFEGQAVINADEPSVLCDTAFCLMPPLVIATVSPNPMTPEKPGPIYFVVGGPEHKPSSVVLNIYSVTTVPLVHREPEAVAYATTYRVEWDGNDENHHPLASGEYVYALTVDGRKSVGKLVIVR